MKEFNMSSKLTERVEQGMDTAPVVACMKKLMMVFNFIFWITGVLLMALGIYAIDDVHIFMELSTTYAPGPAYVLIVIGAVIILGGAVACMATIKGHHTLLYALSGLLVSIFIIELSTGIAILVHEEKLHEGFKRGLEIAMDNYKDDGGAIDQAQKKFHCCGIDKYDDWWKDRNVTSRWENDMTFHTVPMSCCAVEENCKFEGPWEAKSTLDTLNTDGCLRPLTDYMSGMMSPFGGVAIGISFFTALGAVNAVFLARSLDKSKYESM